MISDIDIVRDDALTLVGEAEPAGILAFTIPEFDFYISSIDISAAPVKYDRSEDQGSLNDDRNDQHIPSVTDSGIGKSLSNLRYWNRSRLASSTSRWSSRMSVPRGQVEWCRYTLVR
jgi:hypothetical protein